MADVGISTFRNEVLFIKKAIAEAHKDRDALYARLCRNILVEVRSQHKGIHLADVHRRLRLLWLRNHYRQLGTGL